ncbi:MAG: oligoribonuclease, partial [Actinobacteria bacterium]|nr:oligoribonuclease [Actinomycetota bacterium]
ETMVPFVQQMHETSGLTELVRASTVTLGEAEQQVLDYIKRFVPEPRTAPLCGNSIATDRGFIIRDMPELDAFLHYRMIDVSSIKELARRWYRRVYFGQPAKGLAHRALADIHESVQELRYYRATIFVPPPGPSSDEAAAAAAAVLGALPTTGAQPATGEHTGGSATDGSVTGSSAGTVEDTTVAEVLGAAAGAGSASGPSLAAGVAAVLGEEDAAPTAGSAAPDNGGAEPGGRPAAPGGNPVVPGGSQPLD